MKLTLTFSLAFCVFLAGCSSAKAPSSEQIQSSLDSAVKKDNPAATAKLTDIAMEKDGKTTKFKFNCTNCMLEDATRTKKTVASAKGEGAVWIDPQDGKWKFNNVTVDNQDGTKHTVSFEKDTF